MAKKKKQRKHQSVNPAVVQEAVEPMENKVFQEKLLAKVTPAKYRLRLERVWLVIGFILIGVGLLLVVNGISSIVNKPNNSEPLGINLQPSNANIDDGASDVRSEDAIAEKKANITSQLIHASGRWQATDYVKGDIGPGNYTVKLGDTLWEIAEAVYGSGFEWNRILEENKQDIGFLPVYGQALIIPGQVLKVPK